MTTSIVVEGEIDKVFLDVVLGAIGVTASETVAAGGRSSAVSLARSYLILPHRAVALVADANTSDSKQVQWQQAALNGSLAAVAPHLRFGVFLAVPEMEECLFSDPNVAAAAFGNLVMSDVIPRGQFAPRRTLMKIMAQAPGGYLHALRTLLLRPQVGIALATCSPFLELWKFIEEAPYAHWLARGFRWPRETHLRLASGVEITIAPVTRGRWLQKDACTQPRSNTSRFYRVTGQRGDFLGEKSELDISKLLGERWSV